MRYPVSATINEMLPGPLVTPLCGVTNPSALCAIILLAQSGITRSLAVSRVKWRALLFKLYSVIPMPLLGHAFTGMATSLLVSSTTVNHKNQATRFSPFLPVTLVTLAYLPDIGSQLFLFLDWHHGRNFGHSLLFSVLAAIPAGFILRRQTPFTLRNSLVLAFTSIVLHDILDILQSTDRQPFWPFYTTIIGDTFTCIPTDPIKEAILFAAFYCIVLSYSLFRRKRAPSYPENRKSKLWKQLWTSRLLIAIIIVSAVASHHLRSQRLQEFKKILPYLKQQKYSELLQVLDKVDKWPRIAKAGRIDYYRGVAYMKQQKTELAEKYLLRSYSQDQNFFWCIADLALVYASSDRSQQIRASLAAPYIYQLETRFCTHADYLKNMNKIQHHLSASQ